ncbi:MAG TPA: hypothetical protein VNA25_25130 [Phycisphaerae bacterium]|nr:hypothetical protein [Phycisphaerae bacterium]HUT61145.1 hypothetical protein [Phycisphaerae bacterium]
MTEEHASQSDQQAHPRGSRKRGWRWKRVLLIVLLVLLLASVVVSLENLLFTPVLEDLGEGWEGRSMVVWRCDSTIGPNEIDWLKDRLLSQSRPCWSPVTIVWVSAKRRVARLRGELAYRRWRLTNTWPESGDSAAVIRLGLYDANDRFLGEWLRVYQEGDCLYLESSQGHQVRTADFRIEDLRRHLPNAPTPPAVPAQTAAPADPPAQQ